MLSNRGSSVLSLTIISGIILMVGLGIAVVNLQQQQSTESHASGPVVGDTVPGTPVTIQGKNAAGNGPDAHTISGLTVGVQYKIVAKGVIYYQKPAAKAYDPGYTDLGSTTGCFCVRGSPLSFNGVGLSSQETSPQKSTHQYTFLWTADKTTLEISANDAPGYYYDNQGSITVSMTVNALSGGNGTKFNLNLLHHGIGKGGDNRNPNGGGNPDPKTPVRNVLVTVLDLDDNVVVENKQGEVTFDPDFGGFKGQVDMGSLLESQSYVIKVKLSDSLWGTISRNITGGTAVNDIPVMKLVNGDVNGDGLLDIQDYNIIIGCYSDFDLPAVSCDDAKKGLSDIDDDGNVNQFDLNLFLREMSVQQ